MGGETLVTGQAVSARQLARVGHLCVGRRNRLLAFRGDLLHGVVPGAGVGPNHRKGRRVTFMVAFWRRLTLQDKPGHGTARPFARFAAEPWAASLVAPAATTCNDGASGGAPAAAAAAAAGTTTEDDEDKERGRNGGKEQAIKEKRQQQQQQEHKKKKAETTPAAAAVSTAAAVKKATKSPKPASGAFFRVPVWEDVDRAANELDEVSLDNLVAERRMPGYDEFFQFG
jgi:hypothetical protein